MPQVISVLILALFVAGCETTGGSPSAICNALIGPIKYNSSNPSSPRHAGAALAPELAVRNRVGANLHCPLYR